MCYTLGVTNVYINLIQIYICDLVLVFTLQMTHKLAHTIYVYVHITFKLLPNTYEFKTIVYRRHLINIKHFGANISHIFS